MQTWIAVDCRVWFAGKRRFDLSLRKLGNELVLKAAKAFAKPGFDRQVIFGNGRNGKVFAYSVHPDDPSKIIREAPDGTRTIGRLVGAKFRPFKDAARRIG